MSPLSTNSIREDFLALREQCMWARVVYNNFRHLYGSDETIELLKDTAAWFFHDINVVLQEYCLLQIAKLTDPSASVGRENLTIPNLNDRLKAEGLWTQEIDDLSAELMRYRDLINLSRNRLIAHSDKATIVSGLIVGAHADHEPDLFFRNLNVYTDVVARQVGEDALSYAAMPGPGDVLDLIKLLRDARRAMAGSRLSPG